MKTTLQNIVTTIFFIFSFFIASAQPGALDSSFGINGKVTSSFGGGLSDIALQQDGKIVAVGTYSKSSEIYGFLTVRFKPDGSIDSSFGDNGKVITFSDTSIGWRSIMALTVIIQPDNKILVGGTKSEPLVAYGNFAMARYLPNGTPDSTFGINGLVITDVDPGFNPEAGIESLALQPDGKILAAGSSDGRCLIRYHPNGIVDSSFGLNGKVQDVGGFDYYNDIALQTNGKIVTAGTTPFISGEIYNYQIKIGRLRSNGNIDSSFGNNGAVILSFYGEFEQAKSIKIVENNKILSCGFTNGYSSPILFITKLNSNGSFDSSFGQNGKIVYNNIFLSYDNGELIILPDGKFLVIAGKTNFQLYRFNSNGTIDSTFGVNGMASANFTSASVARAAALQADGKIVVGGTPSMSLARFKGVETAIVSLAKNVSVAEGNSGTTPVQFKVALDKPSTTDVFVNYTTKNITATAGSDYIAASGTVRIKAGKTKANILLSVTGDNVREANERFAVVLSNPVNAVLGTDSVVCVIKNDDAALTATASNNENIQLKSINIYPNPAKDIITIEGLTSEAKIVISDVNGKPVIAAKTTSSLFQQNIKQLAAGTYYIKIETENKTFTKKIIKL